MCFWEQLRQASTKAGREQVRIHEWRAKQARRVAVKRHDRQTIRQKRSGALKRSGSLFEYGFDNFTIFRHFHLNHEHSPSFFLVFRLEVILFNTEATSVALLSI
jgi:hypothetical protein